MTELNLSRRRRVHGHHSGGSPSTTTTGGRNNSFHLERPYSHPRPKPYRSLSHSRNNNSNFNLRLIRYVLHGLGVLSLVLVLFLARRLEGGNDNTPSRFLDVGVSNAIQYVSRGLGVMTVESDEEKVAFHKIQAPQPHDTEPTFGGHDDRTANIPEPHVSVSVLDPRLTEMVDRASIQSVEQGGSTTTTTTTATLSTGDPVAKKHFSSTSNDNVLVVIISNRRDGIIPTIASIIKTASKPVDVVLIGEHVINNEVGQHFGKRINEFISLSVQDITDDLVGQNIQPIWTWDDWHVSMDNPQWRNENTIHIGPWDNLKTHAHELNHIRFYLAHVSIFKNKPYFYFLDDDILVQKDLGVLAQKTMDDLDAKRGLVCPCNIWMWDSGCFHFEFQSKKDYILSMPSLYGDREVCKADSENHCVPANYWDWVKSVMPEGGDKQHAWNFGFSLFALDNWRNLKLTEKYEEVMRASYRLHVFPETSLTFGLGVSYIAFAGNVECWNEDYVQVRDGFGFIEWNRYSRTFGKDFFDTVDVVHYTGPDKPWVEESRIEPRAITPWLEMMEHEKMPIPKQLPIEPTDNLVTLLASDRTGAQWVMSTLDGHPQVCASGEGDKPETGFPADVLMPDGLPWYPTCSIKKGCTYEFVLKTARELVSNTTAAGVPVRCADSYDAMANADPLVDHLERMCNVVERLGGNYEASNIARLWVDAFVREDRELVGCGCVRGVKAKTLKVMTEWIIPKGFPFESYGEPRINLNHTRVSGSKIIRLKRNNLWARYKSLLLAQETGVYHPTTAAQKQSQLDSASDVTIDIEHMEWNMKNMEAMDRAGDDWARDHASDILWLEYEDCRADMAGCFSKMYQFMGVDAAHVLGKKASSYESLFASFVNRDNTMEHVANKGEVMELLGINGWAHYVSDMTYSPIQFLTYEASPIIRDSRRYMGINATLYGQGQNSELAVALPVLKSFDPSSLVVLNGDRDGRVNFPVGNHDTLFQFLHRFRSLFEDITSDYPNAVVVSTSSECCASALTHANPGDYFEEHSGARKGRSCPSGDLGCQWGGDAKAAPWKTFMEEVASKQGAPSENIYLDSSLIAGKASDVITLIEATDINADEDARAVLTDFMYRNPDKIVLDYGQKLFGESRHSIVPEEADVCFSSDEPSLTSRSRFLDEIGPTEQPLFMYSLRNLGCGDPEKHIAPKYPIWDDNGIKLQPILDHIDRVADAKESIVLPPFYGRKPDYRQGPEVPYVIDEKGIWTSMKIRGKTNNATMFWRTKPTEGLTKRASEMLQRESGIEHRWPTLGKVVSNGGFPFFAWYGDFKTCNHRNYDSESIPLFTTCATDGCTHAFPMPNYMTIIDTQTSESNWRGVFKEFANEFPWDKKINKVVWRGALSEAEWRDALTSPRWRVARLVHESKSDLYDIGLTGIPSWLTDKIQFDLSLIGGFKEGIKPMKAFQRYKAILDMDGNSWSSRFGSLLCYNSVVVKVEPKYFDYFYAELKPWTHFIPVKNDLSDMEENVAWALDPKNEIAVKGIITAANQWCSHRLIPDELASDLLDIFESYVRLLDQANPQWQTEFLSWREKHFSATKLEMYLI